MPSLEIDAALQVEDGGTLRRLRVADMAALPAGASSEATLALVASRLAEVAALLEGAASEATLAQVRDRADFPLPADQVADLTPPAHPASYPLPADQLLTLTPPDPATTVTVLNPTANPETGLAKDATVASVRDRAAFPLPAAQVSDLRLVTVGGSALPAGAASAAKQDGQQASLTSLDGKDYATNAELVAGNALLEAIRQNTADLSVDVASLELTADQVNLNTDELEALLTSLGGKDYATNAKLTEAVSELVTLRGKDYATQTTLAAVLARLLGSLSVTVTNPTTSPETGLAKDATLAAVRDRATFPLPAAQVTDLKAVTVANPTANPETGLAKDATLTTRLPAALNADGGLAVHLVNPTANPETGLAKALDVQAVRDRLPAALADDGSLATKDTYTADEALASQVGAGAVLTFTFSAPMDLVWVRSQGGTSFAKITGTPALGNGIYCEDGVPQPVTRRTSVVKVWAPGGATVYAWGFGG
jgi:hypothetical protein